MAIVPKKQLAVKNQPISTPFQTTTPPSGAFGIEGLGDVGKAVAQTGGLALDFAIAEQADENDRFSREALVRLNAKRRMVFDGDPDKGITGHYGLKNSAAVDNHPLAVEALTKARNEERLTLKTDAARRIFDSEASKRMDLDLRNMAKFRRRHSLNAQVAAIKAKKADFIDDAQRAYSSKEETLLALTGLMGAVTEEARLNWLSPTNPDDKKIIDQMRLQASTTMFAAMFNRAKNLEDYHGALAILDSVKGKPHLMDPAIEAELRGDLKTPLLNDKAFIEFDKIIANVDAFGRDPVLPTAAERTRAVAQIKDADVRKVVGVLVRQHNAALALQERTEQRELRTEGIRQGNDGISVVNMPIKVQEALNRTPGMAASVDKRALQVQSGQPAVSNPAVLNDLLKMATDKPTEFLEQELVGDSKIFKSLSPTHFEMFLKMQLSMTQKGARQKERDAKDIKRARQLRRALLGAKGVIRSAKFKKKDQGLFEEEFLARVNRRADASEKPLEDKDYQEIARGLLLEVEQKGTFLGLPPALRPDPDVVLFKAREGGFTGPLSIVNFAAVPTFEGIFNQPAKDHVRRVTAQVNADVKGGKFSLNDITFFTEKLLRSNRNPDAFNVKQLIKQLQKEGKLSDNLIIGGSGDDQLTGQAGGDVFEDNVPARQAATSELEADVREAARELGVPDRPLTTTLKRHENETRDGRNETTGLWTPHPSEEGGEDTIGFGHKLTPAEAAGKYVVIGGEKIPFDVAGGEEGLSGARLGLTDEQVNQLLQQDIKKAEKIVDGFFPEGLHDGAKNIVISMAFNMGKGAKTKKGKTGLLSFEGMRGALKEVPPNFELAAQHMEWKNPEDHSEGHTQWFNETGRRARELIQQMRAFAPKKQGDGGG